MIRIVHRFPLLEDALKEALPLLRAHAAAVDLYRTLAAGEEEYALTILVADEATYAPCLEIAAYKELLLAAGTVTECYPQEQFSLAEGKWVAEQHHPAIIWPQPGAISIVIQTACEPNVEYPALTAAEITETRREPGCVYYAWFENIETPQDLLLLEVWESAHIYDLHWFGRMRSAEYRGSSGRVAASRSIGAVTREFYRHQEFCFQYGRLQPVDPKQISETVLWAKR